eukprot:1195036-Karenia_brevis.AAC.1
MHDMGALVPVQVDTFGTPTTINVRCVPYYKHLGTQTFTSISVKPLLKCRSAACGQSTKALSKA